MLSVDASEKREGGGRKGGDEVGIHLGFKVQFIIITLF